MSDVLLDTDVFSYLLKDHQRAEPYHRHVRGKRLAVTFITVGELYAGAEKANWGPRKRSDLETRLRAVVVVPYDIEVCRAYARLCNLRNPDGSRLTIAANDRWIAACALRHTLPLVSNNRRHFERILGLQLITEATPASRPTAQPLPLPPPAGDS